MGFYRAHIFLCIEQVRGSSAEQPPELFSKKRCVRNFVKLTRKYLCQSRPQACNFIKKETVAQVFSYEFCEISKNTFFTEYLWEIASDSFSFSKQLFSELLWMFIASYMLKYIKVLVLVKSVAKIKHFLGLSGLFTIRFLFIVFTNCTNLSAAP